MLGGGCAGAGPAWRRDRRRGGGGLGEGERLRGVALSGDFFGFRFSGRRTSWLLSDFVGSSLVEGFVGRRVSGMRPSRPLGFGLGGEGERLRGGVGTVGKGFFGFWLSGSKVLELSVESGLGGGCVGHRLSEVRPSLPLGSCLGGGLGDLEGETILGCGVSGRGLDEEPGDADGYLVSRRRDLSGRLGDLGEAGRRLSLPL